MLHHVPQRDEADDYSHGLLISRPPLLSWRDHQDEDNGEHSQDGENAVLHSFSSAGPNVVEDGSGHIQPGSGAK